MQFGARALRTTIVCLPLIIAGCGYGSGPAVERGEGYAFSSSTPADACNGPGRTLADEYGRVDKSERAEDSTAGDVRDWQENRFGPDGPHPTSQFRSKPDNARVVICIYYGEFNTPTGPRPMIPNPDGKTYREGAEKPKHTELRVTVDESGHAELDSAGYVGRMAPETPADFKRDGPARPAGRP